MASITTQVVTSYILSLTKEEADALCKLIIVQSAEVADSVLRDIGTDLYTNIYGQPPQQ